MATEITNKMDTEKDILMQRIEELMDFSVLENIGIAKTPKILIADDETTIRNFLVKTFEKNGYEVVECKDGGEALEQIINHQETLDFIILDYEMPKMNGIEILQKINEMGVVHIPIMFITAHDNLEIISRAYENGIDVFMRKKDLSMQDIPAFVNTIKVLGRL